MAFFNCNTFINININPFGNCSNHLNPFNFGCFTMPNFFSNFSLFNFGSNNFNPFGQMPYFNLYPNPTNFMSPSIFNFTNNQLATDYYDSFDNYQTNFQFMPQDIKIAPTYDHFEFNITNNPKTQTKTFTGSLEEYCEQSGKKLAEIALKNSTGFNNMCATKVKNAIKEANLGEYETGDAHMTNEILAKNPNFKEIPTEGVNLKELPAGCILVYEKGVAGYSKEYGHVEITTGDGRGVSDGITNNLRQPSSIFIPVMA